MKKRVLSALLVLCMACGLVSTAWATDPGETALPTPAPVTGQEEQIEQGEKVEINTPPADGEGDPAPTPAPDAEPTPAPGGEEGENEGTGAPTPAPAPQPESTEEPTAAPSAGPTLSAYAKWPGGGGNSGSTKLTTVETVDSTAEGVHMYMFDFDEKAFEGGEYTTEVDGTDRTGDVKEGMVDRTTNDDGWPVLNGEYGTPANKSLAWLFGDSDSAFEVDEKYAVNHLFLNDKFAEDGTFYYSAFENFATLENGNDKNFTVYKQLGTPSSQKNSEGAVTYFYMRGNFMPYNTLNTQEIRNYNLYDDKGQQLSKNDPRYSDPLYGFNEDNNFHFGMYVWADFYQPQGGMVENNAGDDSKQMVFEFTGDDDMWVFIDGVLVLDLGGIHDAQSGTINFATGKISYTDTLKGESPTWRYTTLKQQYQAANKGKGFKWDGDTFADGTSHRIQIFYMERGEGASNLKMSFNLKTIPDGQLSVRKDVENYYAPQIENVTYTMRVNVNGKLYANQNYTIQGKDKTGTTNENGQFTLYHDETAVFPDLEADDTVTVKEVATSDTEQGAQISQNYNITYTVTDGAGNTTGSAGTDGTVTATMPGYGSINVVVTNTATFTRPLKLVKQFEGTQGDTAPEGFQATYTLYEIADNGQKTAIGSVKYSDLENGEYIFWLDTGKKYTIEESFGEGDNKAETNVLKWKKVTAQTNDPAEGTDSTDGVVYLDENDATLGNDIDTITLTNHYGENTGDLTIIKDIYGLNDEQVIKLVDGTYRAYKYPDSSEDGLRFDVDVFRDTNDKTAEALLIQDELEENGQTYNAADWTFNVVDTLDDGKFGEDGVWEMQITPNKKNESIYGDEIENEASHFTNASLTKMKDGSYRYQVTISDVDLDNWYRVWEQHMDVPGFTLTSSVEAKPSNKPNETIENYLTEYQEQQGEGAVDDHGGRAFAFELTEDTTVHFTNRYQQGKLTITKRQADLENQTASTTEFSFTVEIPAAWAQKDHYNDGEYPVTYARTDAETKHNDGTLTFTAKEGAETATATLKLYPGETATIQLPTGITPKITENNVDAYNVSWTKGTTSSAVAGNSVTADSITASTTSAVTCTNTPKFKTLTVNKKVTGPMGAAGDDFNFTLTLSEITPAPENLTVDYDSEREITSIKKNDSGSTYSFVLTNDETIEIQVPYNATVSVAETEDNGYNVYHRKDHQADTDEDFDEDGKPIDNRYTDGNTASDIKMNSDHKVEFVNFRTAVAPTGLESDHTAPYALMVTAAGIAGLALIGGIAARRIRRRREW